MLAKMERHFYSPLAPIATVGGMFAGFYLRTPAELICLMSVLIVGILDWITGIAASIKEGKPIQSQRMRQAIPKWIGRVLKVSRGTQRRLCPPLGFVSSNWSGSPPCS